MLTEYFARWLFRKKSRIRNEGKRSGHRGRRAEMIEYECVEAELVLEFRRIEEFERVGVEFYFYFVEGELCSKK